MFVIINFKAEEGENGSGVGETSIGQTPGSAFRCDEVEMMRDGCTVEAQVWEERRERKRGGGGGRMGDRRGGEGGSDRFEMISIVHLMRLCTVAHAPKISTM